MTTKVERLEMANAELQRELREKESELKRLAVRSSLDKDMKKMHTLEQKLRDAYRELENMEGELVASRDRNSNLQYEVDILRSVVQLRDHPELLRIADSEVRSKKMEQELRCLREELVGANEKCRVYFEGCTKAAKEADGLRYKCSQLQEELERQGQDLKELIVERESFVREANDATEATGSLKDQLNEQNVRIKELHAAMRARESDIRHANQELNELRIDEENARRTWEEGQKLFEKTKAQLKDSEAERDKLAVRCHLLEEEERTNQRRYESLQRSVESLRGENKQMRDQLAIWQIRADEIDAMGRRLALTDAEHDKKAQKIASLEEMNQSLSQRLAERDKEFAASQRDVDTLREDLAIQTEQMNVLSRNLMTRLEQMERERDDAIKRRDDIVKELSAAQDKLSTMTVLMTHHQSLNRSALAATHGPSAVSERLAKLIDSRSESPVLRTSSSDYRGGIGGSTATPAQTNSRSGSNAVAETHHHHHHHHRGGGGSSSNDAVVDRRALSPPRQQHLSNLSDVALSPPTPLPNSSGVDHRGPSSSQTLRTRLERLTR